MADTGWLNLNSVENYSGDTYDWSNVSNLQYANTDHASASLSDDDSSVAVSGSIIYKITEPVGVPADSIIDGIEVRLYCSYWGNGEDSDVDFWNFLGPKSLSHTILDGFWPNIFTPGEGRFPESSASSPYTGSSFIFGGPTDRLNVPADTTIEEFFDDLWVNQPGAPNTHHGNFTVAIDNSAGASNATVKIALVQVKIYYTPPPLLDMASGITFGVALAETGDKIQAVKDLVTNIGFYLLSTPSTLSYGYADLAADMSFSGEIAADISEAGWIDSTAGCEVDISLAPATLVRMRNIACNIEGGVEISRAQVGNEHNMYANFTVDTVMDPQLYAWKELQTDPAVPWFVVLPYAPSPDGTIHLESGMVIGMDLDGDNMLVNWALYTDMPVSVGVEATIYSYTNLYSDLSVGMELEATLVQSVDLAAGFSTGVLLTPGKLSILPVPTMEERTLYVEPPGRELVVAAPGRTLYISSQQRNS